MPFETYSNELNAALGGGFDGRMGCIVGGHRTGKTQLAIDIVERFLRSNPDQSVVVISSYTGPWIDAMRGKALGARVHIASSVETTRKGNRGITIVEGMLGRGNTFSVSGMSHPLSDGLFPPALTIFIADRLAEQPKVFDHVVSLSESQGHYWAKVIKNRNGPNAELNITRREIVEAQLKNCPTALDLILGDTFDSIE